MSRSCFACICLPLAVSLLPFIAPMAFRVPYTALGLFGYWRFSLASRNFGIIHLQLSRDIKRFSIYFIFRFINPRLDKGILGVTLQLGLQLGHLRLDRKS